MADHGLAPQVAVILAPALVRLFPGSERRIEVAAATVRDVIEALDRRWPGMRDRICDSTPGIRRHINVFADGVRAGFDTPLRPGSEIFVLTAISGG